MRTNGAGWTRAASTSVPGRSRVKAEPRTPLPGRLEGRQQHAALAALGADVGSEVGATDGAAGAAFRDHVAAELELLLRLARRMTSDQHDAEQLVRATLLRASQEMERLDGRHARMRLLTIMKNVRAEDVRTSHGPVSRDDSTVLDERTQLADRHQVRQEDPLLDTQADPALSAALYALPDELRTVALLVDLDGLSYLEAAVVLDLPERTVMSRLHRARTRLRAAVQVGGDAARRGADDPRITSRGPTGGPGAHGAQQPS